MVSYFELDEIGKAMYRRKMANRLLSTYEQFITIEAFEGSFMEFVEQTEADMKIVENYEDLAALKELRIQKGWNY